MMKNYVTGLQHIGIPTNDIKKSLEFYEKLGFENIYDAQVTFYLVIKVIHHHRLEQHFSFS